MSQRPHKPLDQMTLDEVNREVRAAQIDLVQAIKDDQMYFGAKYRDAFLEAMRYMSSVITRQKRLAELPAPPQTLG